MKPLLRSLPLIALLVLSACGGNEKGSTFYENGEGSRGAASVAGADIANSYSDKEIVSIQSKTYRRTASGAFKVVSLACIDFPKVGPTVSAPLLGTVTRDDAGELVASTVGSLTEDLPRRDKRIISSLAREMRAAMPSDCKGA